MEFILDQFRLLESLDFQVFFANGSYFLSFLLTLPLTNEYTNGYLEDVEIHQANGDTIKKNNFSNNPLKIFENFWNIVFE